MTQRQRIKFQLFSQCHSQGPQQLIQLTIVACLDLHYQHQHQHHLQQYKKLTQLSHLTPIPCWLTQSWRKPVSYQHQNSNQPETMSHQGSTSISMTISRSHLNLNPQVKRTCLERLSVFNHWTGSLKSRLQARHPPSWHWQAIASVASCCHWTGLANFFMFKGLLKLVMNTVWPNNVRLTSCE